MALLSKGAMAKYAAPADRTSRSKMGVVYEAETTHRGRSPPSPERACMTPRASRPGINMSMTTAWGRSSRMRERSLAPSRCSNTAAPPWFSSFSSAGRGHSLASPLIRTFTCLSIGNLLNKMDVNKFYHKSRFPARDK